MKKTILILQLMLLIGCNKKTSNYEDSKIHNIDKKLIKLKTNLEQTRKDYKTKGGDSIYNKIRGVLYEIEFYENQKKNLFKEL